MRKKVVKQKLLLIGLNKNKLDLYSILFHLDDVMKNCHIYGYMKKYFQIGSVICEVFADIEMCNLHDEESE